MTAYLNRKIHLCMIFYAAFGGMIICGCTNNNKELYKKQRISNLTDTITNQQKDGLSILSEISIGMSKDAYDAWAQKFLKGDSLAICGMNFHCASVFVDDKLQKTTFGRRYTLAKPITTGKVLTKDISKDSVFFAMLGMLESKYGEADTYAGYKGGPSPVSREICSFAKWKLDNVVIELNDIASDVILSDSTHEFNKHFIELRMNSIQEVSFNNNM